FTGAVSFNAAVTLDDSQGAGAGIAFDGNVSTTQALVFNLPTAGTLDFTGGTWNQGANTLTVNGADTTFFIETSGTFEMSGGTLNLTGAAADGSPSTAALNVRGTFEVAGNVTIGDNSSNSIVTVTFSPDSTLLVQLGATPGSLTLNGLNASDQVVLS